MKSMELIELTSKIQQLQGTVDHLNLENHDLRTKLASCAKERSQLQDKIDVTKQHIHSLIQQLKEK